MIFSHYKAHIHVLFLVCCLESSLGYVSQNFPEKHKKNSLIGVQCGRTKLEYSTENGLV